MDKKGFTLIELLAVIVVLGVIMTIAGTAVLKQKKKANIEEAKKIEQTIADLGPGIYSYEKNQDNSAFMTAYNSGAPFKISVSQLKKARYLKDVSDDKINNPAGGDGCTAYLIVDPNGEKMFIGYVSCPNLYATEGISIPENGMVGELNL